MIDVNRLRKLSREAAATADRAQKEAKKRRRKANEKQHKLDGARAETILTKLEGKTEEAARAGKREVSVMKLKESSSNLSPSQLTGAAKIVFDRCQEAGLNPKIRWDHDGVGISSWNTIVVSR